MGTTHIPMLGFARRSLASKALLADPNSIRRSFASKAKFSFYKDLNSQIQACTSAAQIESFVSQNDDLSNVNVSFAFRSLARNRSGSSEAKTKLLTHVERLDFSPRDLSNIIHAIASGRLFPKLPNQLIRKLGSAELARFNSQDTANTLWALAKMHQDVPSIVTSFSLAMLNTGFAAYDPQALVNAVWAFASLGVKNRDIPTAIGGEIALRDLADFKAQDLSNAVWSFAKLGSCDSELLDKLGGEFLRRDLTLFSQQALTNSIWGLASLGVNNAGVAEKIGSEFLRHDLSRVYPRNFATVLWAMAKFGVKQSDLVDAFVNQLGEHRRVGEFNSQDLSNSIWALASLEVDNPRAIHTLREEILRRDLSSFFPQAICESLWALIKCDAMDAPAWQQVGEGLLKRDLGDFDSISLSTLLWVLASSDSALPDLSLKLGEELKTRNWANFPPRALSSSFRALATLNFSDAPFWEQVRGEILNRNLAEFSPLDLSHSLWTFAHLGVNDFRLCSALCEEVGKRDLADFSIQAVSNSLWAFATLGFKNAKLCEKISRELCRRDPTEFPTQVLSNLLLSFALLDFPDERLVCMLTGELSSRKLDSFLSKDVVLSMWALACLDMLHLPQVQDFFQLDFPPEMRKKLGLKDAWQLFQTRLAWSQTKSTLSRLIDSACSDEWIDDVMEADDESQNISTVQSTLSRLLLPMFDHGDFRMEASVFGGFAVDMLVPSRRAVIEVDGPQHFFLGESSIPTGKAVFKRRLLERAGFHVFCVPVMELGDLRDKQKAMQSLAKEILSINPV